MKRNILFGLMLGLASPAVAETVQQIPSNIGVDGPELAAIGRSGVGFRSVTFVHKAQPDLEHPDPKTGAVALRDRSIKVDIWYPAEVRKGQKAVTYRGSLWGEPPLPPVAFAQLGLAIANAKPAGRGLPLVIFSHGYGNEPGVMTWLTENLASKGYVVAAIHHVDPNRYVAAPIVSAAPTYNRPVDISFVAAQLRASLGAQIDPENVALIGYSQGGYGVLTAGGASLDPAYPFMNYVADGWLKKIARGSANASLAKVPGVKAIVALAPAGGGDASAWGKQGLAEITAPLLLIAGDQDPTVGYEKAAKSFFAQTVNSDRYLLTLKQAGHAIGLNPAPADMRRTLWDIDWFEDPIWRKDRITAINLHFITAFLDLHLRGARDKQAYLDVPVEDSDVGTWKAPAGTSWGAYSPGGPDVTLWKGFQQRRARGMTLQHLGAGK
ncbi:MAG: alpha/beta hydrolase family protein [Chakrabartia sp.]